MSIKDKKFQVTFIIYADGENCICNQTRTKVYTFSSPIGLFDEMSAIAEGDADTEEGEEVFSIIPQSSSNVIFDLSKS